MIPSILDNDFYKFTMQCAVVNLFPNRKATYKFINRGKHKFPEGFGNVLQKKVGEMAKLFLTKTEKKFLTKQCPYLPPTYIDFLEGYRYNPDEVNITQNGHNIEVKITGYWYRTILWEVFNSF